MTKKRSSEKKIYPTGNLFAIFQNNELDIEKIKNSIEKIEDNKIKEFANDICEDIIQSYSNHQTMRDLSEKSRQIHTETLNIFEKMCVNAEKRGLLETFKKIMLKNFTIWNFDNIDTKSLFYTMLIQYFKDPKMNLITMTKIKEFEKEYITKTDEILENLVKIEILEKEINYDCPECLGGGNMIQHDHDPLKMICSECGTEIKTNSPDVQCLIHGIYYHRGKNFDQLESQKYK